jgi:2-succinyl-5-enolpyruvyl-6-hydroxy-3-cyclohexene-1-carboxylate synthase
MLLPSLYNIAEICAKKGIRHAVISPGSRSAALTIAFAQHPDITTKIVPDERSAAFIALGMAQSLRQTVVLICTSGSAAYNYAPAIAEAFFQEIPLLILTADRPPEWVAQRDGQTIFQENIYGKHVKASFQLPSDYQDNENNNQNIDNQWFINRIINDAINLTQHEQTQPVHVNVPIREPFYPNDNEVVTFDKNVRIIEKMRVRKNPAQIDWNNLMKIEEQCEKQLIVVGQTALNPILLNALPKIYDKGVLQIPIVADLIGNAYPFAKTISHHDLILMQNDDELNKKLQPDLLITIGKSVLSKSLKQFLRKYKPKYHWHIQEYGEVADTFQSLTHILPISPEIILEYYINQTRKKLPKTDYLDLWQNENQKAKNKLENFFLSENLKSPSSQGGVRGGFENNLTEFSACYQIMKSLPKNSILHLANSMAVRYANYLSLENDKNIEICANRGTSGIDGSNSAAVGHALTTDKMVVLLTGDMSFLYDRNAFWHNHKTPNLKIIVLNNHGGGIFRILPEPAKQPELDVYFETKQVLNTENLAKDFNFGHIYVHSQQELSVALESFFEPNNKTQIIEIQTDSKINATFFQQFKNTFVAKK